MLGRLSPEQGAMSVLGSVPGEEGSAIPGSAVGYSPQEIALYHDLSIAETLLFHGRLHGMNIEAILTRQNWLVEFLDLPESSRPIANLSGGHLQEANAEA